MGAEPQLHQRANQVDQLTPTRLFEGLALNPPGEAHCLPGFRRSTAEERWRLSGLQRFREQTVIGRASVDLPCVTGEECSNLPTDRPGWSCGPAWLRGAACGGRFACM